MGRLQGVEGVEGKTVRKRGGSKNAGWENLKLKVLKILRIKREIATT